MSHGPFIAVLQGGAAAGGAAAEAPTGPVLGSQLDLPTQNLVKFLFSGETFKWDRNIRGMTNVRGMTNIRGMKNIRGMISAGEWKICLFRRASRRGGLSSLTLFTLFHTF